MNLMPYCWYPLTIFPFVWEQKCFVFCVLSIFCLFVDREENTVTHTGFHLEAFCFWTRWCRYRACAPVCLYNVFLWRQCSFIALLSFHLQVDPKRRLIVKQLLDHPWVMKGYSTPVEWHSKHPVRWFVEHFYTFRVTFAKISLVLFLL